MAWLAFVAMLGMQAVQPPAQAGVAADLDRMLASKDYGSLFAASLNVARAEELMTHLNWEQARVLSGTTSLIALIYARDLWRMGAAMPNGESNQIRQTSGAMLLYAFTAIQIDGTRCADSSAPQHRLDQLVTLYPEIWEFVRSSPIADRERMIELVLLLDRGTARVRNAQGDDEFLCRFGLDEMIAGLARGPGREVPAGPGQLGRTIEVESDPNFRPRIHPPEVVRPLAEQRRAALAATLRGLAGLPQ